METRDIAKYPYFYTDMLCCEIEAPFDEIPAPDLRELVVEHGFDVNVNNGVLKLNYDKDAIARLLETEIDYLNEEVQNYAYYHGINPKSAPEWLGVYIKPNRTLGEIIEDIEADWELTDEQRDSIYRDDS